MNTPVLSLNAHQLDQLIADARNNPRRRLNLNLHPTMDAAVHRLAIAMEPDSYVRPHRHSARWELLIVVRGRFDVLTFDDDGRLTARTRLSIHDTAALQYEPNTWHTLLALDSGSVFFEVKEGPYLPVSAADWLPGTPAEGATNVPAFLQRLANLSIGEPV